MKDSTNITVSYNFQTVRKANKSLVLKQIRDSHTISRIKIAEITGLNKATVSSIVDELIKGHLVKQVGYDDSRGGRRPIKLKYYEASGKGIAIEVKSNYLKCSLFDLGGNIVYSYKWVLRMQYSADLLLQQIRQQIETLIEVGKSTPLGIIGIGIVVPPEPGDKNDKDNFHSPIPREKLKKFLASSYNLPVFVETEVGCGMGLLKRRKISNAFYVNVGSEISGGIMMNGEICRQSGGGVYELGHTTICSNGIQCQCGNYGCWQEYSSVRALKRYIRDTGESVGTLTHDLDFVSYCVSMARENSNFQRAFETVGWYLGVGIANLVKILNPEKVILGGTLISAYEILRPSLHQSLLRHSHFCDEVSVEPADDDSVMSGLAELVIASRLDDFI